MTNPHGGVDVSPWVEACLRRIAQTRDLASLSAIDLACGSGRHANYLASLGVSVHAVDKNMPAAGALLSSVKFRQVDLEEGPWPLEDEQFDIVIVTNYLHRSSFNQLLKLVKPHGGTLIYETFMQGNELYGSPRRADFLLQPGELLSLVSPLNILGFEQGERETENPAVVQRILAVSGQWSAIQSETKLLMRRD